MYSWSDHRWSGRALSVCFGHFDFRCAPLPSTSALSQSTAHPRHSAELSFLPTCLAMPFSFAAQLFESISIQHILRRPDLLFGSINAFLSRFAVMNTRECVIAGIHISVYSCAHTRAQCARNSFYKFKLFLQLRLSCDARWTREMGNDSEETTNHSAVRLQWMNSTFRKSA